MKIIGLNGKVATKPYPTRDIKVEIKNGFGSIQQKNQLTRLEVVYGDGKTIAPGDFVYMLGDSFGHAWAKTHYEMEGQLVIVIPVDQIQLVEKYAGWNDNVGVG